MSAEVHSVSVMIKLLTSVLRPWSIVRGRFSSKWCLFVCGVESREKALEKRELRRQQHSSSVFQV